MVLDDICKQFKLKSHRDIGPSQFASFDYSESNVFLMRPLSYMNLSGRAVKRFLENHNISDYSKVLIILDDINLPFGVLRLRSSGSAGGQKGLVSVIKELNTDKIPRMRIGIGDSFRDAADYVLSPFSKKEKADLPFIINAAVNAVKLFIDDGIDAVMDKYNKNILEN
jgi:PTH1 family peptidyl-tRNA hydrolase